MRIILDCDEVLADFIGGVCRLFNIKRTDLEANWELGRWDRDYDIQTPLSKTLGVQPTAPLAFWSNFHYNSYFWQTLEPLPWCEELLAKVRGITNDWLVVTTPVPFCHTSGDTSSHLGKYNWLRRMGVTSDRVIVTPHKHYLAGRKVVLIDDSQKNCDDFIRANGHTIVFPTHHNKNHQHKANPLAYVFPELKLYTEML